MNSSDKATLVEKFKGLECLESSSLEEVQVPVRYPVTKEQYAKWNSIWPLAFHESTYER